MARDILVILVSTVSIESAFSTSSRVLDQFCSSLGPKMVEALVCDQYWLRVSDICIDIERFLEDVEIYEEGNIYMLYIDILFLSLVINII
ncbi:putative ac transposase [Phtheirospermum japonicum]|uniref:Putative ac transposase n=1 Tax=Phtheirospermum japonicum TaxID=374723 RepID=A0A830BH97_9LAMI|nr:putative ac transposase [Phtheirospermum japonicum]